MKNAHVRLRCQQQSLSYDIKNQLLADTFARQTIIPRHGKNAKLSQYIMQKVHRYDKLGAYFGEKALEDSNKHRLATVLCETECHVAYLTKEDYIKLI